MKTILVPTDYSDVADNALQYAIELAAFGSQSSQKVKIILLHVYQIPVPTGEVPLLLISPQELQKDNETKIKILEKKISDQTEGKILVESIVSSGFTVDEIKDVIKEQKVDLVIMGVTGTGKIGELLIGSHTSSLMRQIQTPVLVVPKEARFREIKKIVLTYSYNEVVNKAAIYKLKEFAILFNAKVLVLDVEKPVAIPMYENSVSGETLEKSLKGVEHVMFYTSSEDIADGINTFADQHNCDWIAMIPHEHSVLGRLFHKSNTKKMAFHTHIPLLSIHE